MNIRPQISDAGLSSEAAAAPAGIVAFGGVFPIEFLIKETPMNGASDESAPAGVGHNSGDASAQRRAEHIEAITDWVNNRRKLASECLTPEEIGASENRVAILLHGLVIGVVCIYREALFKPDRSESFEDRERGVLHRLGVYVAVAYLSNNEKGYCTASAGRIAALLGCDERTVRRALGSLIELRLLAGGRKETHSDRHWLVIGRKVAADPMASVVWLLDATSAPVAMGRPKKSSGPHMDRKFPEEVGKSSGPHMDRNFNPTEKSSGPSSKSSGPNSKSSGPTCGSDETLNSQTRKTLVR